LVTVKTHIRLFLAIIVLLLASCKHKEKQLVATNKSNEKKTQVKPRAPGAANKTAGTSPVQQKLNLSNKEIKNNKLYSFIDDWYGTPYKYAGCQKTGVDCSCFVNILYETVYGKRISRNSNDIFKECDKISIDEAKTGDLVFFKIGGNTISHVGIYIKNKLFVHSSTSKGVIINDLNEAYYKKYFFCAGKMKNV
jgi:lipoprotein Spr